MGFAEDFLAHYNPYILIWVGVLQLYQGGLEGNRGSHMVHT